MPPEQMMLGAGVAYEAVDYDDGDGLIFVPTALSMDREVDIKSLGAWVIMKSFGKFAEASLAAYAERAGCTEDTFRTYQVVLVKAGWCTLLREGKFDPKDKTGSPRLWWMSRFKNQSPPLSAFDLKGPVFPAPGKTKGMEKPDPKHKVLLGSNSTSSNAAKSATSKHPDQDSFWKQAQAAWTQHLQAKRVPLTDLAWPAAAGFNKTLTKRLQQFGGIELARRWALYLGAAWPPSKSLTDFLRDPDKWAAPGAGPGNAYHTVQDVHDFKG